MERNRNRLFAIIAALLLLWGAFWLTGCAPPPGIPNTPGARNAYTADQVVLRVKEVQDVVIALHGQGAIPTNRARLLVEFTVDAAFVLRDAADGWQRIVVAAWDRVVARLPAGFPAGEQSKLVVLWTGVTAVMDTLRQAAPPGVQPTAVHEREYLDAVEGRPTRRLELAAAWEGSY